MSIIRHTWYVIPGKLLLNAGGDSSFKWMGMTPHAPCTKNCMKKPVADSERSVVGRIQAGIMQPEMSAATTMVRLRPNHCDT